MLEVRIFLTSLKRPKADVASLLLHIGLESAFVQEGVDMLTGLEAQTEFGRPDFHAVLWRIKEAHTVSASQIGVFVCGPKPLSRSVRSACETLSVVDPGAPTFQFHQEFFYS